MLDSKKFDYLIIFLMGLSLVFALGLLKGHLPIESSRTYDAYSSKLFDDSRVHEIDIFIEDKDAFLANALDEEYVNARVVIDGEEFSNIGLRTKGANSKTLTHKYGHERYSMKLEFDHYEEKSYYGLDKLSLDSSFQDNAYMKTYFAMDMMRFMGVKTPLTSYSWVRINGQDWGLFLAIEEIEEAFALRNYGPGYGKIYKGSYRSLKDDNYDVKLIYTDDDFKSYANLFDKAKFKVDDVDKKRLVDALRILDSGENLDQALDLDANLSYFVPQVFVVNLDSYLGPTAHNYFLYEEGGKISMLPWDYNLAFTTYSLGKPEPVNDSNLYVNYPIATPAEGYIMKERPLYHKLMQNSEYFNFYLDKFDYFIREYFESGYFVRRLEEVEDMIEPYVEKDPTAYINYQDHKTGVQTFKDFNLLRAESVRRQLDGTIPMTLKGQKKDKNNFVDASHIKLEDMGEVKDLKDGVH